MNLINCLILLLFFVVLFLCSQKLKCTFKGGSYEDNERMRRAIEESRRSQEEDERMRRAIEESRRSQEEDERRRVIEESRRLHEDDERIKASKRSQEEEDARLARQLHEEERRGDRRPPRAADPRERMAQAAEERQRGIPQAATAISQHTDPQVLTPEEAMRIINRTYEEKERRRIAEQQQQNQYGELPFRKNMLNSCGTAAMAFAFKMSEQCRLGGLPSIDQIMKEAEDIQKKVIGLRSCAGELRGQVDASRAFKEVQMIYTNVADYYELYMRPAGFPVDRLIDLGFDLGSTIFSDIPDVEDPVIVFLNVGSHWISIVRCNRIYALFDDAQRIAVQPDIHSLRLNRYIEQLKRQNIQHDEHGQSIPMYESSVIQYDILTFKRKQR